MSEQLRPTPETDNAEYRDSYRNPIGDVPAEVCRRLERERDELADALRQIESTTGGYCHGSWESRLCSIAKKALASLKGGSDE